MTPYQKYLSLELDGSLIGFEQSVLSAEYFCTPMGAKVLGWDNGIHYCTIRGFGQMVFTVDPEALYGRHVYPVAASFRDFLRLVLATGHTASIHQIIGWTREQFEAYLSEYPRITSPEQERALSAISDGMKLSPMDDPFGYVKAVQADFDYDKIKFTGEYYDVTGLEDPNPRRKHAFTPVEFEPVIITVTRKREKEGD